MSTWTGPPGLAFPWLPVAVKDTSDERGMESEVMPMPCGHQRRVKRSAPRPHTAPWTALVGLKRGREDRIVAAAQLDTGATTGKPSR